MIRTRESKKEPSGVFGPYYLAASRLGLMTHPASEATIQHRYLDQILQSISFSFGFLN
jgi:hypothetical protein